MERLLDDASNIHSVLPWIESQKEILFFLRNIPLDQFHLRIQLALSYFLKNRDESEENSEQNIEDDAREIVILLPDTPYNLIKNRLRELGNIHNRKEIVVKNLINDRPELRKILAELEPMNLINTSNEELEPNNLRKRASQESQNVDDLNDNKETNIKIKIRKVEGSLEVVSCIQQDFPSPKIRPLPVEETITSHNSTVSNAHQERKTMAGCINNCTQKSPVVSVIINNTNTNTVPQTYNLIEYLRELTHATEDTIRKICGQMKIPLNKKPDVMVLNELLNRVYDHSVIEVDDNDSDATEGSSNGYQEKDEDFQNVPKDYSTKDKHKSIIKPATFVFDNKHKSAPSTSTSNVNSFISENVKPLTERKFTVAQTNFTPNRITMPAMPQVYLDRIAPTNKVDTISESPEEFTLDFEAFIEPPELPQISSTDTNEVVKDEDMFAEPFELDETIDSTITVSDSLVANSSKAVEVLPKIKNYDEKLVLRLIEMFPEACPDYIRTICQGKKWKHLDHLVTVILSEEYPRRPLRAPSPPIEVNTDVQFEIVTALLPDADPTFLRWKCETIGNNTEQLNDFINEAREKKDYPTMKEYLRKQKFTAQSKQYTTEFKVENFVELFPNPEKTFRDLKRTVIVDNYTALYICNFFQIRYDRLPMRTIRSILTTQKYKILQSDDEMQKILDKGPLLKTRRKPNCLEDPPQNITILQELAYLTHKADIENYVKERKLIEEEERQFAKENRLMENCQCCYDDEVMPKNSYTCPAGCVFCKDCIQKSCEVAVGDGKTEFKCLNDCPEEFSLQVLQKVLPPKMFSKLAQKKALAEVKAAGIEELESCPFCDFASIPIAYDKIFRCLNPDCMKESCRLCKEENHVPYKCDEIEKDEDVKARVFVENKMTEALLCKCYKCGTSFFKEEGCNKMTCTCGANMCYICKQPVKDYTHFNGIGGDKFHLCPLYSDTNEINKTNVSRAAEQAKSVVDPAKLKVDPTLDVRQHYENRKKALPVEPHMQLINMERLDLQRARLRLLIDQQMAIERRQQRRHQHH